MPGSSGGGRMDIFKPDEFFRCFPNLTPDVVRVTSAVDQKYNCIAWAAGESHRWWWPSPYAYWPPGVPREETLDAFVKAFATLGYSETEDFDVEAGVEKIAIYTRNGEPMHAARQLVDGSWSSKCGRNVDIEHELADLFGPEYGRATHVFARQRQT